MTQKVDFVPLEIHVARKRRGWILRGFMAVATVALVVFAFGATVLKEVAEAKSGMHPLERQVAEMRVYESYLAPLSARLEEADKQQKTLKRLVQGAVWVDFLDALSNASNERIWLTECRVTREAQSNNEEDHSEITRMAITGVAASDIEIIEFMSILVDAPCVESLRLETSRSSTLPDRQGMIEFSVAGTLR